VAGWHESCLPFDGESKKPRNVMRTEDNSAAAQRNLAVLGGISDRS
jgi:hypothetical protein